MKNVSVAEAKNTLPELVHQAERGAAVQITRRGEPVAVLVAEADYRRLKAAATAAADFSAWTQEWRSRLQGKVEGISQDELARWREL